MLYIYHFPFSFCEAGVGIEGIPVARKPEVSGNRGWTPAKSQQEIISDQSPQKLSFTNNHTTLKVYSFPVKPSDKNAAQPTSFLWFVRP